MLRDAQRDLRVHPKPLGDRLQVVTPRARTTIAGFRRELRLSRAVSWGMRRVFLLSPAHVGGVRAKLLLHPRASFALARAFRREGLPLADVFTFASGLYFRGKIAYARRFADAAHGDAIRVITSNAGLAPPELRLRPAGLRAFGATDIDAADERFRAPLRRDAAALARALAPDGAAILLGSIATAKYRDVLLEVFGPRLVFPAEFVGRGDMSRGALLLRAADAGAELAYVPVAGAAWSGRRARGWRETLGLAGPGLSAGRPRGRRRRI